MLNLNVWQNLILKTEAFKRIKYSYGKSIPDLTSIFPLLYLIKQQECYKNHLRLRAPPPTCCYLIGRIFTGLNPLLDLCEMSPCTIRLARLLYAFLFCSIYNRNNSNFYFQRRRIIPSGADCGTGEDWQQNRAWGTLMVQGAAGVDETHLQLRLTALSLNSTST